MLATTTLIRHVECKIKMIFPPTQLLLTCAACYFNRGILLLFHIFKDPINIYAILNMALWLEPKD